MGCRSRSKGLVPTAALPGLSRRWPSIQVTFSDSEDSQHARLPHLKFGGIKTLTWEAQDCLDVRTRTSGLYIFGFQLENLHEFQHVPQCLKLAPYKRLRI